MSEEIKFIGKIGTMGKSKKFINIPKEYWKDFEHLKNNQVKVIVIDVLGD